MREHFSPNFATVGDYKEYIREVLIPDLLESGNESTAEDFEEAIYWLEKKGKKGNRLQDKGVLGHWWTSFQMPGIRWHLSGKSGNMSERCYTTSQVEDFLTGAEAVLNKS